MSAVSLLESREQYYIKAMNNNSMCVCLHVCLHVNVQGKDESCVYHQAMYYWCLRACVCMHCQDESYVSKVYGQAMCYWSLCICICTE